ncbi:hypothetical protein M406DRAFT_69583 [Cryphonectria parasitica EP155]|uniref:Uncharacterized protein n=1 Tax=Cryphonectria parasitica (strain ATCC 38755 / EP155) TaxID=660469 RepID=A0A9P4Y5S3_CRYP1|nr:uncharacterized protein M406DRAFT_69583 [Cryphonectria parasitica EP155]KAF3767437.1 hypothetical protein M406DRAFT_69583 [Cryphonectria parasitica EP155]
MAGHPSRSGSKHASAVGRAETSWPLHKDYVSLATLSKAHLTTPRRPPPPPCPGATASGASVAYFDVSEARLLKTLRPIQAESLPQVPAKAPTLYGRTSRPSLFLPPPIPAKIARRSTLRPVP